MQFIQYLELPVAILVAVIGWYLASRSITYQQKKELRLQHLIETYFMFRELENKGINDVDDFNRFQRAINSFYLFGDKEQIEAMERFKELHMGSSRSLSFDNINRMLVREIRQELGLSFYKGKYGIAMSWGGTQATQGEAE